jgi:hypothetical protein
MEKTLADALLKRARLRVSFLVLEARKAAFDAGLAVVAALMALAGIGCAIAALWLLLAPMIGAAGAALAASAVLMLAGGMVLWARRLLARQRPAVARDHQDQPDLAEAALKTFSANRMVLLLGALAAGAAAAEAQRGK